MAFKEKTLMEHSLGIIYGPNKVPISHAAFEDKSFSAIADERVAFNNWIESKVRGTLQNPDREENNAEFMQAKSKSSHVNQYNSDIPYVDTEDKVQYMMARRGR